jgi:hypothetical protein
MSERRGAERDGAKEAFWRRVIEGFDASRDTVRSWCAEQGVSEPSFYAWRRELAARDRTIQDRAVRLLPVEITPSEPTTIAIELSGGLRLSVPLEHLHEVLEVLERRRC